MLRLCRILLIPILILSLNPSVLAAEESALERIQERGQLILGTSGNMPSMSQADSNGAVTGFDIDIARFMANLMEVELVTRVMPFNELLGALESGKVDVVISNLTITQKRNLRVAFVGPYMTSGKCFVTRDEALARSEAAANLNMDGIKLAVLKGSTSEDVVRQLYPRATVVAIESYERAAEMVIQDEVKGILTDYAICMATIKDHPDAGFISLFSLLTYEPIGIALPVNDAQIINWTEHFLKRMNHTGTLEKLSEKWFGKVVQNP